MARPINTKHGQLSPVSLSRIKELAADQRVLYMGTPESEACMMARELLHNKELRRCELRDFHLILDARGFCAPSYDRRCLACVLLEAMER